MKNIITINHINCVGGVEEFIYQLAKNYKRDFTVYYRSADPEQLQRLMQYCDCIQFTGKEQIECERAFFDYGIFYFIENIKAKDYIEVIHADYKVLNIKPHLHNKVTKYICVSETVKRHFLDVAPEVDPDMCEVAYNPLQLSDEERKPALLFGSFTRMTAEKGGERIKALAQEMNRQGINYLWFIFTDYADNIHNPNVVFVKNRLKGITNIMASLDYIVQVSDSEGHSYTEQQAKFLSKPMIHTPYPAFYETGVRDGDIMLEFDLSNMDEVIEKIKKAKKKPIKMTYVPMPNKWEELLLKGGDINKKKKKGTGKRMKIKALVDYFDTYERKDVTKGEVYDTTEERANLIARYRYAEILEEVVEEKPKKRGRKKKDEPPEAAG